MSTDYAPAKWIPTNHMWSGRGGHTPKWIIVHGTAGGNSADGVGTYFQSDNPPTSTHYVVGLNGEVVQCVAEADSAWGNGVVTAGHDPWWTSSVNPNFLTFSIEHVKPDTNNGSQLTQAQKEASFALIKHLCEKHNIPKQKADANGGITGHYSIDPVNKSHCPGPYPWDELFTYLSDGGGATVGVPTGWKDDGAALTAPNGIKVQLGFRWYILTHPWLADNWPIEAEHYAQTIDITNPSSGSGTVQHFRKSILAWQESTGDLVELWAGATSLAWEQRAEAATVAAAARTAAVSPQATAGVAPVGAKVPVGVTVAGGAAAVAGGSSLAYIAPSATRTAMATATRSSSASAVAGDPIGQRISSLEHQIQTLITGLSTNPKTRKIVQDITDEAEVLAPDLAAGVKKGIFSNPRSLIRWVLMIVGLLFSDIVAWFVSSIAHHPSGLPLPFLTVGTVVSGLAFLSVFRR